MWVGVTLIHHSASQARQGRPVDFYSQPIQPGDLVFVSTNGSGAINHVGIAINDTLTVFTLADRASGRASLQRRLTPHPWQFAGFFPPGAHALAVEPTKQED